MPRISQKTKAELSDALAAVFYLNGYEGASLADLANAAELSKASLYHHFPGGKAEIAKHVLGRVGVKLQKQVIAPLAGGESPTIRLKKSLDATARFYHGEAPSCLMNTLALGRGGVLFGADIAAGVRVWTDALRDALVDGGLTETAATKEAQNTLAQIQGSLVISRAMSSRAPLETTLAQIENRLVALL